MKKINKYGDVMYFRLQFNPHRIGMPAIENYMNKHNGWKFNGSHHRINGSSNDMVSSSDLYGAGIGLNIFKLVL